MEACGISRHHGTAFPASRRQTGYNDVQRRQMQVESQFDVAAVAMFWVDFCSTVCTLDQFFIEREGACSCLTTRSRQTNDHGR